MLKLAWKNANEVERGSWRSPCLEFVVYCRAAEGALLPQDPKKLLSIFSVKDLVCQTIHLWVVQSSCLDMATNMLQISIASKFKSSCSGISPPSDFNESFELKSL